MIGSRTHTWRFLPGPDKPRAALTVIAFQPGSEGRVPGERGLAARFEGDVDVSGNLTKASGGFRIDHPLDPENRYLNHSFVESPEMKNLYDGVVTLDERGRRW